MASPGIYDKRPDVPFDNEIHGQRKSAPGMSLGKERQFIRVELTAWAVHLLFISVERQRVVHDMSHTHQSFLRDENNAALSETFVPKKGP